MSATIALPRAVRMMDVREACAILYAAWHDGKHRDLGDTRAASYDPTSNHDGSGYVLADVPLDLVRQNEDGDRYDCTVDAGRAARYAGLSIQTPVHLLFGARNIRRGATHAAVLDGGHRVSAARLRGDPSVRALMQRSHFDLLQCRALNLALADGGPSLAPGPALPRCPAMPSDALYWAAGTAVVAPDGQPLVVYHATDCDFDRFEHSEDIGFHFGSLASASTRLLQISEGEDDGLLEGGNIRPSILFARRLLATRDLLTWSPRAVASEMADLGIITPQDADEADLVDLDTVRGWLAAAGYDGISYPNATEGGGESYIVFDADQVRPALDCLAAAEHQRAHMPAAVALPTDEEADPCADDDRPRG